MNTFCPLPWVNLSTDVNGSLRPCCKFAQPEPANEYQLPNMKEGSLDVLWNDKRIQELRQAFLNCMLYLKDMHEDSNIWL